MDLLRPAGWLARPGEIPIEYRGSDLSGFNLVIEQADGAAPEVGDAPWVRLSTSKDLTNAAADYAATEAETNLAEEGLVVALGHPTSEQFLEECGSLGPESLQLSEFREQGLSEEFDGVFFTFDCSAIAPGASAHLLAGSWEAEDGDDGEILFWIHAFDPGDESSTVSEIISTARMAWR